MHASILLAAAALVAPIMAVPAATAVPEADLVERDGKEVDQFSPWVEVDNLGQPVTTHTPTVTTTRGVETTLDVARYELTGSVFTFTYQADVWTSTGEPPNPTANARNGEGSFSRCFNKDGPYAPFCRPSHDSTIFVTEVYYVTWDPDFFEKPKGNSTLEVAVRADYLNHTTNKWELLDTFSRVSAEHGYWVWPVDKEHKREDFDHKYTNITLQLIQNIKGSEDKEPIGEKIPLTIETYKNLPSKATQAPTGDTLKIALPVSLGSVFLLMLAICLWNRKTRRIGLGNVMSRNRNGYTGKSRRRMFRRNKDQGIQLDTRPVPPEQSYRDIAPPNMPRRDSDDLDSLAGSPVVANFHGQGPSGGRNAFRDEVSRQDRLRQEERRY